MATGLDPGTGLFEQFAGFFALEDIDLADYAGRSVPMDVVLGRERTRRSQVVKQADVVALLGLLPEEFAGDTGARNFRYYEPRCSHGSSLSRAMHGLVAARLGYAEMALRYFRQTAAIDLADTHAAIDGGVHIAALGGIWLTAVFGFAGLSLHSGRPSPRPESCRRTGAASASAFSGVIAASRSRSIRANNSSRRPWKRRADDACRKRKAPRAPSRPKCPGLHRGADRPAADRRMEQGTTCATWAMEGRR